MSWLEKDIAEQYIEAGFPEPLAQETAKMVINTLVEQNFTSKYRYTDAFVIIDNNVILVNNFLGLKEE